jgi:hypothetical protein
VGARVILCGEGGDAVAHGIDVFEDLWRHQRWLSLAVQLAWPGFAPGHRKYYLRRLVGQALPPPVRNLARRRRARERDRIPSWAAPETRALWDDVRQPHTSWPSFPSQTQAGIWRELSATPLQAAVESLERYGRQAGVQFRFPYLDADLAELVLGIPYQARLPWGHPRRLQEDALWNLYPPEIRARTSTAAFKANFGPVRVAAARAAIGHLRDLLQGPTWNTGEFVDQREARLLLERLVVARTDRATEGSWMSLWNIGTVEAWLRSQIR